MDFDVVECSSYNSTERYAMATGRSVAALASLCKQCIVVYRALIANYFI